MVIRVILCAVLVFCICLTSTVTAADWPNWRGPDHNGISTESGWETGELNVLWRFALGTGYSSIAVSDGRAYSMGNNDDTDTVYCVDVASGKEIWRHSYPEPLTPKLYKGGPNATPTVTGGKVFTISKTGKAFCLDVKTGGVIWKRKLGGDHPKWGVTGSAVVIDDMVIFNVGVKGIALNAKDGEVVWNNGKGIAGYASAVPYIANGQKAVALFTLEHVVGVVAATGKELWSFPWKTKHDVNAADPVISGDLVFIASGYGRGCALLKISGSKVGKLWENKNMRSQMSGPVFLNGFLYGIDHKQLSCLDLKTGQVKWSDESVGNGSLMAADGKLIVLSEKGELIIADASPDAFKPIATKEILSPKCWTSPVLSNGRIFARDPSGDLVCIELKVKVNRESSASARQGRSSGRNRRDRSSWYGDLSEEEQAWMRNRRENPTEEEKAERSRGSQNWQNASDQEKEQMRADWHKRREDLLKEMREALSKGSDWPQFLGPGRTGTSSDKGLARSWGNDGPEVLWEKKLGPGYGAGAIKDGKVYILDRVGGKQDVLRCLDILTGKEEWTFSYDAKGKLPHPGSRAVPTVDNGKIYIVSVHGLMHCVDAVSHKAVWKKDLTAEFDMEIPRWGLVDSPLIYKDMVIVAPRGKNAAVAALKKETGEVVWKSVEPTGRASYATPIVANICGVDQVLFNSAGKSSGGSPGKVVGISATDGKLLWAYKGWSCKIPIPYPEPMGNDMIFVSGGYGAGCVMLKVKKVGAKFETEEVFKMTSQEWKGQIHQPIIHQGHMYIDNNGKGSDKPGVICMSLDGEIKWSTGDIKGSPKYDRGGMLMADGMIYVVDANGYLRLMEVNPKEYKELASAQFLGGKEIWAPLSMSDGKLLIRDQEKMLCLDVRK